MDMIAVNKKVALRMFWDAGFNNEELLQIAANAIEVLDPVADGYYLADDVVVAIRRA